MFSIYFRIHQRYKYVITSILNINYLIFICTIIALYYLVYCNVSLKENISQSDSDYDATTSCIWLHQSEIIIEKNIYFTIYSYTIYWNHTQQLVKHVINMECQSKIKDVESTRPFGGLCWCSLRVPWLLGVGRLWKKSGGRAAPGRAGRGRAASGSLGSPRAGGSGTLERRRYVLINVWCKNLYELGFIHYIF